MQVGYTFNNSYSEVLRSSFSTVGKLSFKHLVFEGSSHGGIYMSDYKFISKVTQDTLVGEIGLLVSDIGYGGIFGGYYVVGHDDPRGEFDGSTTDEGAAFGVDVGLDFTLVSKMRMTIDFRGTFIYGKYVLVVLEPTLKYCF